MENQLTVGAVWQDREDGTDYEVIGVKDGRVQISPVSGGDYRIMSEKSLRSNYKLVAIKKEDKGETVAVVEEAPQAVTTAPQAAPPAPPAPPKVKREPKPQVKKEAPAVQGKAQRAPSGHVKTADGIVIAGSAFITGIAGLTRDATYKVDSPIRWLAKPDGQALLKRWNATIVFGEELTKK